MKSCFAAVVLAFVSSVAFAGDAGEPKSVLVQPAAPAVVAAAPACAEGTCCTESSCRSSCRAGLFGRTIERTRTVTRAVVEVPVRVVAAPARAVRARGYRGCCCQ